MDTDDRDYKLFLAFVALLVWIPLPLASNRPWAWAIMQVAAFVILAVWLLGVIRKPTELPPALKTAAPSIAILCLWLLYTLAQAVPLPAGLVETLNPRIYELYSKAFGENMGAIPMSMDKAATLTEFLKGASYVAIFVLTLALINSRERLRITIKVLVTLAMIESVYGLFNTLTGIEYIWWNPKAAYVGNVTGTYVNRNHFAGYLEMMIPLGIGLLIAHRETHYANLSAKIRAIIGFVLDSRGRLAAYVVIMFAALFLTASRAGVASIFAAFGIVMAIGYMTRGKKSMETRYAPHMLAAAVLAGLWLGLGTLPERIGIYHWELTARVDAWIISIEIFKDYPVFGAGAGSFMHIFPMYRDGTQYAAYYDHAHNDYLEILANQGLVGFALAASAMLLPLYQIWAGFFKRNDVFLRGLLFGCVTGTTSILIHAIIDFNFQIPANAAYFYVLLAIGITASTIKRPVKT